VLPHSPIAFDAGPDRTKCNSDTLHINAPPAYLNYTWSNNYNINSTTSQNVIVNPSMDTAYYVKAEKTPGCFAYDTVKIHVNTSPLINIGVDKSFCNGDSAVFNAGSGFGQYIWSNGSNTPQISIKTAGTFSVIGVTMQGCKSYDTVRIVNVFANPAVSLDHADFLCSGSSRVLDAGKFSSYVWNDGSTSEKIILNNLGTYAVQVTDNNGCKGNDTTTITTILALPSNFLPPDTSLCSYDRLTINPLKLYNSYQWSNNASVSSLTVSQPGTYWLQVKDDKGCIGRDSIIVNPKDCMEGFYVPTAFTPNGDGKNDVFRPLLFGNVKKYEFKIYNRWGQIVYQTSDLSKAWDGTIAGVMQDPNVFVWSCTYQFVGEQVKTERGTLVLIK
jgi:gliding motility-associated-like protein